jgi:uncharacterized membrane protein
MDLYTLFGICMALNWVVAIVAVIAFLHLEQSWVFPGLLIGWASAAVIISSTNLLIATYTVTTYGWREEGSGLTGVGTYFVSGMALILGIVLLLFGFHSLIQNRREVAARGY